MDILRGLASHVLDCGCVVGVYETHHGALVRILDFRGGLCQSTRHRPGTVWTLEPPAALVGEPGVTRDRGSARPDP